jgi:hypothetical protein
VGVGVADRLSISGTRLADRSRECYASRLDRHRIVAGFTIVSLMDDADAEVSRARTVGGGAVVGALAAGVAALALAFSCWTGHPEAAAFALLAAAVAFVGVANAIFRH